MLIDFYDQGLGRDLGSIPGVEDVVSECMESVTNAVRELEAARAGSMLRAVARIANVSIAEASGKIADVGGRFITQVHMHAMYCGDKLFIVQFHE